jgi:hypothetical protein
MYWSNYLVVQQPTYSVSRGSSDTMIQWFHWPVIQRCYLWTNCHLVSCIGLLLSSFQLDWQCTCVWVRSLFDHQRLALLSSDLAPGHICLVHGSIPPVFIQHLLHSCKYYSSGLYQADSGNCPWVVSKLLTMWSSILGSVWSPLQFAPRRWSGYLPADTYVPTHVLLLSGLSTSPEISVCSLLLWIMFPLQICVLIFAHAGWSITLKLWWNTQIVHILCAFVCTLDNE